MRKKEETGSLLKYVAIIAANIKRLRGGMSEEQLAKQAKVARGTIQRLRAGKPISLENLIKIAETLGVTPADLFITDMDRGEISYKHKLLMDLIFKDKINNKSK
jgi:transcriptional regulator with XRE-family HTH domain